MLYGSTGGSHAGVGASGSRRANTASRGVGLAILASASLFLLGQLPRGHPIIPALHFRIPHVGDKAAIASPAPARLHGPRVVRLGSRLTISGALSPDIQGIVKLRGDWGTGRWQTLARSASVDGS